MTRDTGVAVRALAIAVVILLRTGALLTLLAGPLAATESDWPKPYAYENEGRYCPSKLISQVSRQTGWRLLEKNPLPSEALEVRAWVISAMEFQVLAPSGRKPGSSGEKRFAFRTFSIRQDGSGWTGRYVENGYRYVTSLEPRTGGRLDRPIKPRSSWGALWARLIALDLLTLPDDSELPNPVPVADGVVYVVELSAQGRYRAYCYSNPSDQRWPEARKLLEIFSTLEDELLPKPWELRWWWWSGQPRRPIASA